MLNFQFLEHRRSLQVDPGFIYWMIIVMWWLYVCQAFWSIGMATQDQINFSMQGLNEGYWHSAWLTAEAQGRVYFIFTKIVETWLSAHADAFSSKLIALLTFAIAPWCFAYAFFVSLSHRLIFIWLYFSFVWVGFHHLPPAAYPVTNDAPFILWAVAAWLIRRGESAPRLSLALVFIIAFMAFFQYEPIALMSIIGFGWMLSSSSIGRNLKFRLSWAVLGAAILYAAVYIAWRYLHPSSYAGNQFGDLALGTIAKTFFSLTLGAVPVFSTETPLLWGDAIIGRSELFMPSPETGFYMRPALLVLSGVTILAGLSVFRLLTYGRAADPGVDDCKKFMSSSPGHAKYGYFFAVLALLLMLLSANGLLSIAAKYQEWGLVSIYTPYLTSRLALLPLLALMVMVLFGLKDLTPNLNKAAYWLPICVLVGVISIWVNSHNQLIAPRLRANLTKWEAASALAQCADSSIKQLVAPGLFYSVHSSEPDWGGYWSRFVNFRFGREMVFLAHRPSAGEFGVVELHHADDGSLQGLTLAFDGSLAFISDALPPASALFTGGKKSWPILGRDGHRCAEGPYKAWVFTDPRRHEDKPQRVELVNAIPSGEAQAEEGYSEFFVHKEAVTQAVRMLYLLYFARPADPGGLDYWSGTVEDTRGNLYSPLQEFERIKGQSTADEDAAMVIEVLSGATGRVSADPKLLLDKAHSLPPFGRRWLLFDWVLSTQGDR